MALVKIKPTRVTEPFIAEEPIGQLAAIYISTGGRSIKEGTSATQQLVGGVNLDAVLSGKLARVVTQGIVSGVICGAVVSAGDRVTCVNVTSGGGLSSGAGKIAPLNTITPAGTVARVSGALTLISGAIVSAAISGLVAVDPAKNLVTPYSLVSGIPAFYGEVPAFAGTSFNTAMVLGKALDYGGWGSGIRVLVTVGG